MAKPYGLHFSQPAPSTPSIFSAAVFLIIKVPDVFCAALDVTGWGT